MKKTIYPFIVLLWGLLIAGMISCESFDTIHDSDKKHGQGADFKKLEELAKAALSVKVYSIIEADPNSGRAQPTYLANAKLILFNEETQKKITSQVTKNGINVFLDLEPGSYRLHQLLYDDPLSFPVLNLLFPKIDDRVLILLDDAKLKIEVEPQKLQYGGDFSVIMTKKGIKTTPPEYHNEEGDLKKAAELIMANFPHSRWTVWAMKILKTSGNF